MHITVDVLRCVRRTRRADDVNLSDSSASFSIHVAPPLISPTPSIWKHTHQHPHPSHVCPNSKRTHKGNAVSSSVLHVRAIENAAQILYALNIDVYHVSSCEIEVSWPAARHAPSPESPVNSMGIRRPVDRTRFALVSFCSGSNLFTKWIGIGAAATVIPMSSVARWWWIAWRLFRPTSPQE